MTQKTTTKTEYALCRQRKDGNWYPVNVTRYGSRIEAERAKEEYEKLAKMIPGSYYSDWADGKVMKRLVTVTTTDWEEV